MLGSKLKILVKRATGDARICGSGSGYHKFGIWLVACFVPKLFLQLMLSLGSQGKQVLINSDLGDMFLFTKYIMVPLVMALCMV